jgi:hypothetical protein
MAATTRAITPTLNGPFNAPNRPSTPGSASRNGGGATFGTHLVKSPRGLSPGLSPAPLTGAAAMAEERRYRDHNSRQTSPNPAAAILQNLQGNGQSHPSDAPQSHATHGEKAAKPAIIIPELTGVTGDNMQTSPVSLSSYGDGEGTAAPVASAGDASAGPAGHAGHSEAAYQRAQHQAHHHQHFSRTDAARRPACSCTSDEPPRIWPEQPQVPIDQAPQVPLLLYRFHQAPQPQEPLVDP